MELFGRYGFDQVTVEDVAQAATVSKKTVFNYFPTKEDLVFAHVERREEALLGAVEQSRELGAAEAFRRLCLRQVEYIPKLRKRRGPGSGGWIDLVQHHSGLHRRLLELNNQLTRTVADAFAAQVGGRADDPLFLATAAALVGAQGALHRSLRQRVSSTPSDAAVIRAHRRDVERVFAALAGGLDDFGRI